jgi:hypothetical protein
MFQISYSMMMPFWGEDGSNNVESVYYRLWLDLVPLNPLVLTYESQNFPRH